MPGCCVRTGCDGNGRGPPGVGRDDGPGYAGRGGSGGRGGCRQSPDAPRRASAPPLAATAGRAGARQQPAVRRAAPDAEPSAARAWSAAEASASSDAVLRCADESSAAPRGLAPRVSAGAGSARRRRRPAAGQARRPDDRLFDRRAAAAARPPTGAAAVSTTGSGAGGGCLDRSGRGRLFDDRFGFDGARRRPPVSPFSPGAAAEVRAPPASAALAPSSRAPASCPSGRASRRRCRRSAA